MTYIRTKDNKFYCVETQVKTVTSEEAIDFYHEAGVIDKYAAVPVIKEGKNLEDLIMPGDLIVDSDGKKTICHDTFFIEGKHYWSLKPIREVYVRDGIGMYTQVMGYDRSKRKLVLL